MTRYSRCGVAMILVIMLIGLMGITLATLSHSCRLMLAQTELQRQGAVDRNLVLSGLAWARQRNESENRRIGESEKSEGTGTASQGVPRTSLGAERTTQNTVTLDVNEVSAGAGLTVAIEDANDAGRTVRVTTFVPSSRFELNRTRVFRVAHR
jgi:type II secretory pathway component PulK